ncbi:MAG: MotA/TolQ/ExbB proton channel family protein [Actinomycetota bacterium]|nr:MotA/TolQ/ExbB proton channel family protein [Actinomycetota bacterium]
MDIATTVGIAAGFILILMAILQGGSISIFFHVPSMMITFGGTIAATLINFTLPQITGVIKILKNAFFGASENITELIAIIVKFAEKARKEGLLSLEDDVSQLDDPFMQKGIQLVIDGTDPELVRDILVTELSFLEDRHKLGKNIFEAMASYGPAFGMIGTLIGLVQMLRNLDDPSKIGPGMAVALLTTFYGALSAYLIFTPIAGKLSVKSGQEILNKELMIEGILSIQAGNNPRIIEEKLMAFLPPKVRADVSKNKGGQGG